LSLDQRTTQEKHTTVTVMLPNAYKNLCLSTQPYPTVNPIHRRTAKC